MSKYGNHTYNMHSYNGDRNGCARKENESDEQYRTVLYEDVARLSDKLQRVTGKRPVCFRISLRVAERGECGDNRQCGHKRVYDLL